MSISLREMLSSLGTWTDILDLDDIIRKEELSGIWENPIWDRYTPLLQPQLSDLLKNEDVKGEEWVTITKFKYKTLSFYKNSSISTYYIHVPKEITLPPLTEKQYKVSTKTARIIWKMLIDMGCKQIQHNDEV